MAVGITFVTELTDTADASTYTFTGASIGTAAYDRYIYLAIGNFGTPTLDSVTVGGSSAQVLHTLPSGNAATHIAAIFYPSGTTADIVTVWSTTINKISIGVWAVTGHIGLTGRILTDTTLTGDAVSVAPANILADSGLIAITRFTLAGTVTWTNATEAYDTLLETASNLISGASATGLSAGTLTVTCTGSGTPTQQSMMLVIISPGTMPSSSGGGGSFTYA
jgi:hypothetical protein